MLITKLQIFEGSYCLGISETDTCLGKKVKIKSENSKGFFPQSCELADTTEYRNDKLSL